MADKTQKSRKKPVSQKRVATVLASLVGALTMSAGVLLLMEGGALGTSPMGAAVDSPSLQETLDTSVPLRADVWKFIIVYESGDVAGSAATLSDGRMTGGQGPINPVRPKANFHFVIDNARSGRGADGNLERGTTWLNQEAGAPYAGWRDLSPYSTIPYYTGSVGVCFIGDLNREPISALQHKTLIQTVRELQRNLNVADDCIRFQWELAGNGTPAQKAYAEQFRRAAGIKTGF
jgi:hypothetical protein